MTYLQRLTRLHRLHVQYGQRETLNWPRTTLQNQFVMMYIDLTCKVTGFLNKPKNQWSLIPWKLNRTASEEVIWN